MSTIISIYKSEERPLNRNLKRAPETARGAELAKSSNSDKTMWAVIAIMLMIFFGTLRFSTTFRETVLESAIFVVAFLIGASILVASTLLALWFKNTNNGNNFAIGTRAAVAVLLAAVCYMFPLILLACAILAAFAWIVMNTDPRHLNI